MATVVIITVDVVIAVDVVACVVDAVDVVVRWLHSKESQGHPDLQLAFNIISDLNYGIDFLRTSQGQSSVFALNCLTQSVSQDSSSAQL